MSLIRCLDTKLFVVCFILLTLSVQISWALRLSKILQRDDQPVVAGKEKDQNHNWLDTAKVDLDPGFQKRVCNGFPCMYSHLGTKAGRASLYRTLAGFIDDCLNDASCDPGRRKRSRIQIESINKAKNQLIHSGLQRRFTNVKASRTIAKDTKSNGS